MARFLAFFLCLISAACFAATNKAEGKWVNMDYQPFLPMQEHYDMGCEKLSEGKNKEALHHFLTVALNFPESPFYAEALFFSGVCYFNMKEYDFADKQFSRYLIQDSNLKHFDEVFEYKFSTAEFYAKGKKKRLFGLKELPKWGPSKQAAIALYEEIIASLPSRELAARALYGKAKVHYSLKEYREAIDALQNLTRQFPKHSLAADAFLFISKIYLHESRMEAQNPDFVGLAQINLQQFRKSFPSDERIRTVEANLNEMQEVFAHSLYETGRFYERKKKPTASAIYYNDTIKKFPDSTAAQKSHARLKTFDELSKR